MRSVIVVTLAVASILSGCGSGSSSNASSNPPPVNRAPTANAGADQNVDEGTTVKLSGTGVDSDGTVVSYRWQQENGMAVTITSADMANASFIAPAIAVTEDLLFRLTVTDDDGATGSDIITVTVKHIDPPPPPPPPLSNFYPLGDLPGGDVYSTATGVSDDGSVLVGFSGVTDQGGGSVEAFQWTSAGGMVGLGDLPGGFFRSRGEGVSADGSVVVGTGGIDGSIEAFRWTDAGGMVGLGQLPGGRPIDSVAEDVSADGLVVVGRGIAPGGIAPEAAHVEAYRWTSSTGMVGLGDLTGGAWNSTAKAVSADGSVVVGNSGSASGIEAFRWASGTGIVGLGDLPGGGFDSRANDVSADGSVIVGYGSTTSGPEAVLWTSAGGMMGLGYLPGREAESRANAVSADGSVVVGQSQADTSSSTSEAFIWTQGNGMQSLRDVLIANGATGLDNWELREATGISADGKWVVGSGINPAGFNEAFLANISAP